MMNYELSIYQAKYCTNTFLALHAKTLLRQKSQQTYYYKIAAKLAKAYQCLLL